MAVRRSTRTGISSIEKLGITELYLDDVDELLSLARQRCESAELIAGNAQLDSADDLRSVLDSELSDINIRTQSPSGNIYLTKNLCGVVFYDTSDAARLASSDIRARLNVMGASRGTKYRLRILGTSPWLSALLYLGSLAVTIGLVLLFDTTDLLLSNILFNLVSFTLILWASNARLSTAVIVTETRAKARTRFADAKVSQKGAMAAGIMGAIVTGVLGYLVAVLTRPEL